MFDVNSLDAELKQLKAQTLSEYGKKIEIAIEMITKKERILNREEKILLKIDNLIKKSGFFKRKKLKELRDRVDRKIIMLKCELSKLKDLKERYINDYKNQREYLGLYDHEFVDKFFQ